MGKLKILFDAGPLAESHKTGIGYYTEHLMESVSKKYSDSLAIRGYYFDFLGHNHKRPPLIANVEFHRIKFIPGKLLAICRRLKFQPPLELFIHKRADIVLYTNYVSLPSLRNFKTALVVYDLSFLDHPEYLQEVNLAYLRRFCPPSISRADIIITISEFTKDRLLHYFPDIRAEIVITPIPPSPLAEPTSLTQRLVSMDLRPKNYILYLGTVEPRKNIGSLVAAYAALPKTIQDQYSLVIAGGKGWKDEGIMTSISNLQVRGIKIILTGYIDDTEKDALYSNAACFVLPSHYEGFGMPILEAMQHGLPVAVSDIPVFHEVAGNAAIYFDKDSTTSMTEAMVRLLTDTKLGARLSKQAVARVKQLSWSTNATNVYEALIREGH